MNILKTKFVNDFIMMANDGWNFGWHERNGGNLSYRIKDAEVKLVEKQFNKNGDFKPLGVKVPKLADEYFLVTGSGKYFRNVILRPTDSIGIVQIDKTGENYKVCWGLENGGRPTSEFPTHLMNHEVKMQATNGAHRVIYHAHTPNVIALTFVLPLEDKVFSNELWRTATECPVIFPAGIGVTPWMVPGGSDIAEATSKLMEKYNVAIWAHHGTFCSGSDFDEVFGLMHTVEKSAEILVKVMSMSDKKLNNITSDNLKDLAKDFNVNLTEDFL